MLLTLRRSAGIRRFACGASAVVLAGTAVAGCGGSGSGSGDSAKAGGSADPHVTLRLADYLPTSDPWTGWSQALSKKVSADTSGAVQIKVYPNGELVSQSGYLQAIQSGSVDLSDAGLSELATISPSLEGLAVADLPFRVSTWKQADAIAESSQVRDIQNAALEARGLRILSTCTEGFSALVTKKPINSLADLKGMKIRVAAPADAKILSALGANPDQIAIGETYEALETNAVAGAFSTVANISGEKWYEVAKYVDLVPIRMAYESLVANAHSFDKLSPDEQRTVERDAAAATHSCDDALERLQDEDTSTMRDKGATIVKVSDLQEFVRATSQLRQAADNASALASKLAPIEDQAVKSAG